MSNTSQMPFFVWLKIIEAIISHRCVHASSYEYAKNGLDVAIMFFLRNFPFCLASDESLSFRHFPRTTMPKTASPRPSPNTQDYPASLLCFLQPKSSAPSSLCLSSWIATAKDEDMESIPRCDHGQLAYRLHSIWRPFCTVSDGESSSRQRNISGKG